MPSFEHCMLSLGLGSKLPPDLRASAAEHEADGLPRAEALQRAVSERLEMARMEERTIVKTVREAYEAAGGKKREAGAPVLRDIADESGPRLADVREAWDAAGIKSFISERKGVIHLSQIVVPAEARGDGVGTRAMQQLVEYADQTGQRITLSPSADFGGNKVRLTDFYKRFGFVENKGRNKDYEVSESMYREPDGHDLRDLTDQRTIEVDGVRRPIRDSRGNLLAPDYAGQLEFWKSFKGETDARGRPILDEGTESADVNASGQALMTDNRIDAPTRSPVDYPRGADAVRTRLTIARDSGQIDRATADFALWALDKSPALANDLAISIRRPDERGSAGSYKSAERIMTLFHGNENTGTAVHEILHHSERMMPADVQGHIVYAWRRAYAEAYEAGDAKLRAALDDMRKMATDKQALPRVIAAFRDGTLKYGEHYQLSNPSEYWAMNATRIMAERHAADSWQAKAKQWLVEMVQKVRSLLGLSSDASVLKGLAAVLDGSGEPVSPQMLVERAAGTPAEPEKTVRDVAAPAEPEQPELPPGAREKLAKVIGIPKELIRSAVFNTRMMVVPMAAGAEKAQALAKDFANQNRRAASQWNAFDKVLRDNYSEEQLHKMWVAADRENDLRRDGLTSTTEGLASLSAGERKTVELLHAYGEQLWAKAKNAGLVEGDGVAFWTPRVAARIVEDGSAEAIRQPAGEFSKDAANLRTAAASLKVRKHETTAESEAALKAKLGDDAEYVKNIRVMPMAMAQLERAIAGRTLVNQIRAHGKLAGDEIVSDQGGRNFVTFDHPALKQWRPKTDWQPADMAAIASRGYDVRADGVYRDGEKLASYRLKNGQVEKLSPMLDSNGKPVLESSPLFVRRDFAGPLKAVFTKEPDAVYRALMDMKGGVTSMIMISPLTHNLVIWGKAMPTMISTMGWKNNLKNAASLGLRAYFVGNTARADHALMNELVEAGLVPVSGRGMNQDVTAIANGIQPGRSLTAKALGAAFDMASPKAGDAVRRGVDKAGEFWHEKLLWDRVADMQAGMAVMMRTSLMDKGIDQYTANRIATHFANRYGGMIPAEAMSEAANKLLNLSLFSKSFTMTNLGAYKDLIGGLPGDVKAQIKTRAFEIERALGRDEDTANKAGAAALSEAQKIARRKAAAVLILDIGAMTTVASLAQALWQGQTGQQIADDFKERLAKLGVHLREDPLEVAGHPLDALASLSQTADNPHGKEDRVRVGEDEEGNTYYARLPVGKVGEELKQYGNLTTGLHLLNNKMSTFLRPIADLTQNEDFTGKRIIDPHDNLLRQAAAFGAYWVKSQIPMEDLAALGHLARGDADHMDKLKLLGTATGLSVGRLSGGDAVAEIRYQSREDQARLRDVLPDVREALRRDDLTRAEELLDGAGLDAKEQQRIIRQVENPNGISKSQLRRFNRNATDEERERLERMRNR